MKTPISHPDSFQQTGKQPIILFALSLIFALSILLPDKCLAQEKEAYAVLSENVLTFYYDQDRGNRKGIKYDMNSSGASSPWHGTPEEPSPITTVIFDLSFDSYYPETCSDWFLWCTNLTEIKGIEYLHTDNADGLSWMFDHCENLETIDVSHFKTTKVKRMDGMFSNCKKLTELDVSNFDTKQVENMECMFAVCENLTELIINFETPKVKSMNSMFAGCSKLTKLDMGSSFTAENVSDMFSMFSSCNELTSIDLSHFNTSNVTRMDNMFLDCTALTSIIFPTDFNTRKVERMDEMFSYCVSMKSLDLRTFNTENVVDMRGMFESCEQLTTILVSDTWNIDNLSKKFENFENYNLNYYSPIFNRCENLIGNSGTQYTDQFKANNEYTYHQDINYANADDGYLTKDNYKIFYDADGNGIIDDNDNNVSWENGEPPQTNILSSTTITQKPIIDGKVFLGWKVKPSTESDNNPQKTIEIPEGAVGNRIYTAVWGEPYVVIDNGTMTFYCKDSENKPENALRIQEIWNYPEWTDEVRKSVTKAVFDDSFKDYKPTNCGYWFYELINLTDISGMKENLNTSDVKDMGFMFYNCKSLSSIDLSSFQTGNVTNMNNMFSGCKNLTTIDVTSFNTENVKTMAGLFQSCSGLTTIDVHNFNTANVLDMFDWCNYCDNLKVLDLRSFETNNNTDIRNMFCHDVSLTTIIVSPDKWKSVKTSSFENTDIIPENPFIDTPQLIGDKGTGYSENSGLSYAHIDGGASNPGYFTTDSYKIFYDLDGDGKIDNVKQYEWESEPPLNFSIVRNSPIDIPNLKNQDGKTFIGWIGTPITGLNGNDPQKNVRISDVAVGNRIYTAVWEEQPINITIPDNLIYPEKPEENDDACNGNEPNVTLTITLPEGVNPSKYNLNIPNICNEEMDPTIVEYQRIFDIPISKETKPGRYDGIITLYFGEKGQPHEDSVHVTVAIDQNAILHLYEDVIFVNNHDSLYGGNGTYQWYKDGKIIPNANQQYLYDPKMSGVYKAKMYTTDGLEVYSCPIDEGKGLSKNSKLQVKTYPNPVVAGNEFTLEVAEYDPSANYTIHISNSNGVVVKEIANAAQFNTLTLNRGIYSGSITSGDRKQGFKLIVK